MLATKASAFAKAKVDGRRDCDNDGSDFGGYLSGVPRDLGVKIFWGKIFSDNS